MEIVIRNEIVRGIKFCCDGMSKAFLGGTVKFDKGNAVLGGVKVDFCPFCGAESINREN